MSGFDRDLNSFVQAYDSKRLEPPAYDTMDGWGRPVLHDLPKDLALVIVEEARSALFARHAPAFHSLHASRDANPNRDANPSLRHNNGAPNRSLPSRTSDTIPSHANHIANSPPFRWD